MSNNVQQELQQTGTRDLAVAEVTPLTQAGAQYGLGENVFVVTDSGASGSTTASNSQFVCQTGTAADGLATILTLRELTYRQGQGTLTRINAVFGTPQADSQQACGLINAENSYTFGYIGTAFGIIYAHNGEVELQTLTVTTPAAGAENATITVDGTGYTVPLTAGTVQHNAIEIADSLNAQVPNYRFTANNDEVTAIATISGPAGSFAFTSATAVAAWVQVDAGVDVTVEFTPQSSWDDDLSDLSFDPLTNNYYQIRFVYGAARFSILDDEGQMRLVHTISDFSNNSIPPVTTPSFRSGWIVRNLGNTTNITLKGSNASGYVEGKKRFDSGIRAEDASALAIGSTNTTVFVIRNRIEFGERINRAELLPRFISVSTQSNKTAFFELFLNPTFTSDLIFDYVDKATSIAEFSEDNVGISGGRLVGSVTATVGAPAEANFNDEENTDTFISPGDVLALVARVSSGPASDMDVSVSWQEDV